MHSPSGSEAATPPPLPPTSQPRRRDIYLGRIFGIPVSAGFSWLAIMGLLTFYLNVKPIWLQVYPFWLKTSMFRDNEINPTSSITQPNT